MTLYSSMHPYFIQTPDFGIRLRIRCVVSGQPWGCSCTTLHTLLRITRSEKRFLCDPWPDCRFSHLSYSSITSYLRKWVSQQPANVCYCKFELSDSVFCITFTVTTKQTMRVGGLDGYCCGFTERCSTSLCVKTCAIKKWVHKINTFSQQLRN